MPRFLGGLPLLLFLESGAGITGCCPQPPCFLPGGAPLLGIVRTSRYPHCSSWCTKTVSFRAQRGSFQAVVSCLGIWGPWSEQKSQRDHSARMISFHEHFARRGLRAH